MSELHDDIIQMIKRAQDALGIDVANNVQEFMDEVDSYLDEFQNWEKRVVEANPLGESSALADDERERFRDLALRLNDLHHRISMQAEACKDAVGKEIGEVHRRTQGLKKYIDQYPQRISITGKRKG